MNHVWLNQSQKGKLTNRAKILCLENGIEIKRMERVYTDTFGRKHQSYSNVYPRQMVDQATVALGLVASVRPVSALG